MAKNSGMPTGTPTETEQALYPQKCYLPSGGPGAPPLLSFYDTANSSIESAATDLAA